MATAKAIRDELASVPEIAHFNLDRAALRIAGRKPLIEPIADTGRYQISAIVPGRMDITYCDDLEVARATLAPFIASHREDANAHAGIYDMRAFRTVDSFRGGQVFGPRDTRHPLERIFGRLIAKGDPVTIIDPRGIRTFNGER
jgi:hypothetical protein